MTARSATTAAALLVACGLTLAGCASAPEPTERPTPSRTASPSASLPPTAPTPPSSEPAPEPEPEAEPAPNTCDTVLTPEAATALSDQGLELREGATQGYPLAEQFAAAGAIACTWAKPQSDVFITVVQLPVADGEQDMWGRVLAENGFARTDDPVPGSHTGPVEPGTGIAPVAIVEQARITFLSSPAHATDLTPQP